MSNKTMFINVSMHSNFGVWINKCSSHFSGVYKMHHYKTRIFGEYFMALFKLAVKHKLPKHGTGKYSFSFQFSYAKHTLNVLVTVSPKATFER